MPTDRRRRSYGHEPNGGEPGRESPMTGMGDQIREQAGVVGERVREGYDSARDELSRRYRKAEGMMARHPTPAVLISLGIGFGLGLVLTTMLTRSEETWPEWADRQRHERMRRARHSMKHAHEAVHDAASAVHRLPDAFQALGDSVRQLPDAIARHWPGHMMHH